MSIDADAPTYLEWLQIYEPDAAALDRQRKTTNSLANRPHFSIILAAGEPAPEDGAAGVSSAVTDVGASLNAALDEVLAQTYDRWDLVVLDLGLDGAARELV